MRRARSKRFRRLGSELAPVLKRLGLGKVVAAQKAVSAWPEIAGPQIAAHCRAVDIEQGVLLIAVDSSAWMTQLSYLKPKLMKRLCARVGPGLVSDVRLVLR